MQEDHPEFRKKIFQILADNARKDKPQPSLRALMHLAGIKSHNTVSYHLKALKEAGFISMQGSRTRTLRVLKGGGIPILGHVAAGLPIDNFDIQYEELPVSPHMFSRDLKNLYALRVKGDSMIGACIQNNDFAIIHKQPAVENGEIAAVLIDGQGTLKRVKYLKSSIELISENPNYPPILLSREHENHIFGKMIGLIRSE